MKNAKALCYSSILLSALREVARNIWPATSTARALVDETSQSGQ